MHNDDGDELIGSIARALREPERVSPALDLRVMAEIRSGHATTRLGSAWRWLRGPRMVTISPLGAFAIAAGVAALIGLGSRDSRRADGQGEGRSGVQQGGASANAATLSETREVQFVLVAPSASSVALVGDFNDWDETAAPLLRASRNGVWTIRVPLAPGRYQYTFVIDGTTWMADPTAPRALEDDFGRPNSVITVGETST